MRNLIICCDGTWSQPEQRSRGVPTPTNVARLRDAVAATDSKKHPQLLYYHPGVGTNGSLYDRLMGGATGKGLSRHIKRAYQWACENYQPNDRLFLFGFSRGAYTVRSLAGMMTFCGLLDFSGIADTVAWDRVDVAYDKGYRQKQQNWSQNWSLKTIPQETKIHFIGVWDTVGALGIPEDIIPLSLLNGLKNCSFHDTQLHPNIKHARHALALDEQRASFTPTLWTNGDSTQDVKQLWFAGVHEDIGGGHIETGLSDITLKWMIEEAEPLGLAFVPAKVNQIHPKPRGVLHNSLTSVFRALRTQPRNIPPMDEKGSKHIHPSAMLRHEKPPITEEAYHPTHRLKVGETVEVPIYAEPHWNNTGLYLEEDAWYEFQAEGHWQDASITHDADGKRSRIQIGELAQFLGSTVGMFVNRYRKLLRNPYADLPGAPREENTPWFALVGAIANTGNPSTVGTPAKPEIFRIGTVRPPLHVKKPGYLYAFANDSWSFYFNNHGNVALTVTRKPDPTPLGT